jgi:hypothetical protein
LKIKIPNKKAGSNLLFLRKKSSSSFCGADSTAVDESGGGGNGAVIRFSSADVISPLQDSLLERLGLP